MQSNKIKARLIEQAGSIRAAADQIGENPDSVSATIHYLRFNRRIREKLAAKYRVRFSRVALRQPERQAA